MLLGHNRTSASAAYVRRWRPTGAAAGGGRVAGALQQEKFQRKR